MEVYSQNRHPYYKMFRDYVKDCDDLVRLCMDEEELTFDVFRSIWLDTKIGTMTEDKTGPDAALLAQLMLYIGKHHLVKDITNFKKSSIGAYLVLVFLTLQPDKRIAFMKIHLDDIPIIKRVKSEALQRRNTEILYVLNRIITEVPEGYEQAMQEYGIVHSKWHYDPTPVYILLDELNYLSRKFKEAKRARARYQHGCAKRRRTHRAE